MESIFRRSYYTLQILWEYRKWFYELTDEELSVHPSLACGLIRINIHAADHKISKELLDMVLLPGSENYIYDIVRAETLYQQNDCYNALILVSTEKGAVNAVTFNNVYEEPFVPSPDTGDETAIGLFLMMLTVTSIGFIAIKSKKRRIAE